jgi:hypothetical protein
MLVVRSKVAGWQNEAKFTGLFKGVDPRGQLAGVDRGGVHDERRSAAELSRAGADRSNDGISNVPPWPPALAKLRRRRLRRRRSIWFNETDGNVLVRGISTAADDADGADANAGFCFGQPEVSSPACSKGSTRC